jgi:hypothetical protein
MSIAVVSSTAADDADSLFIPWCGARGARVLLVPP